MRAWFYRYSVALTVIAAGTASSFSENLDAALESQKKKAQSRVYSEHAVLADHKLTVPRSPTEEEKSVEKKLLEMDAKADARPVSLTQPGPAAATVRPAENKNWLTPATLDKDASLAQPNEPDNAWLFQELDRQKGLKERESAAKENTLAEKLLREKTQQQQQTVSPEQDRLKQYQLAPQKLFGIKSKDSDTSSHMTPRNGIPDPLAAIRRKPENEKPAAPLLFSPEAGRISPALNRNPLRSAGSPAPAPNSGSLAELSRPVFSPVWNTPAAAPLTPLEMIRKSSPINRPDPFSNDHTPRIKTSIWE